MYSAAMANQFAVAAAATFFMGVPDPHITY